MAKYEIGWDESHYMEVEADSREDAESILDKLLKARPTTSPTFTGVFGDICVWETPPDIEVSNPIVNEDKWTMDHYQVLEDDLTERIE